MTHESDIFGDDLPAGRGQPLPITEIIDVDYWGHHPTVTQLAAQRQKYIADGWSAVTSEVHRQTVGMPYRIEYRGVR